MIESTVDRTVIDQACSSWEAASVTAKISDPIVCNTSIVLPGTATHPRFCFVGATSPLERLLISGVEVYDRAGPLLSTTELIDRLMNDEVASVLAPSGAATQMPESEFGLALPASLLERRQTFLRRLVRCRFILRQIGLEEVSSHRGAAGALYESISSLWSRELAISVDVAMMLTLGSDRQRHVDAEYEERARLHLPRALGRLADVGVRSYPRLVVV